MSKRLSQANNRNQPELVNEVIKLLVDLKEAWAAIEVSQTVSQAFPKAPPRVEPLQIPVAINRNIASYAKV